MFEGIFWPEYKKAPYEEEDWLDVTGKSSGEWVQYIEDVDVKENSVF